ncbi:tRNA (adenosine(37)-N6)-dimethylallyltransferase MiaA [Psychroflexus planctonicus]|uniref:tRNA dimethylallyltransferase n=1 Tax=Psychroflexus planctonicus TaxID=1526575 RepID=A0ABQ1SDA5_9FLAO|nr:tRNA (adenosine(37)-N6)-dimethylallyltransferase MiaA [Psychroflexus planctonicus]GGE30490.1 tRNA dimethylallyltransferase [Psychroflexus planctonicus]
MRPIKNQLICILGPTAIGKTALAIQLAKHFETEIISADSRQFFKEMNIGTAVPSTEELAAAQHHFIQHISIEEQYSVGKFEQDADKKLKLLFKQQDKVFLVGGSGLYVKAVTEGLDEFPKVNEEIREKLNQELKEKGLAHLQVELKKVDLQTYNSIAVDNPKRVIRALSVYRASGKAYSSFLGQKKKDKNFTTLKIGLSAQREIIYSRIEQRVDIMMENGLLDEAKKLFPHRNLNALNTVGYKELFNYLEGNCTLVEAVSEIKKNTRRFAKRQLTWFKNQEEDVIWFDYQTPLETIIQQIEVKNTQAN